MKKITNLTTGPLLINIRSKLRRGGSPQLTSLMIPGRGKKKNEVIISDESYTDYVEDMRRKKLISVQTIPDA